MLDGRGELTRKGRQIIDAHVADLAKTQRRDFCVVWSKNECTWYDRDGTGRQGSKPPHACDTSNAYLYESLPYRLETCWTVALPEGSMPTHICVIAIDASRIEISPGETCILGSFDDPIRDGERDPAAPFLDNDGRLVAPRTFRGQPVLGIEHGWTLVGPVQPIAEGIVLRDPWPHQIREACREVAGMEVDDRIVERIFRIAHPDRHDFNLVGVLEAA